MPSRGRRRTWVGLAVALIAVAGCASVPTSGSVHIGRTVPGVAGLDSRDVKAIPSGPVSGESPAGIVTGFLDALIDNDGNFATARAFLAPDASWTSATARTTLYDGNSEVVSRTGDDRVTVSMARVGVISDGGRYRVAPGQLEVPFRLSRHQGEWRIAHLPAGVLLSTSDAVRTLEQAQIFYLNATRSRLVPVPILVQPDQPGLATTLVQSLLAGPSHTEAPAIVSAAPRGVGLVGNVPISDGVAEVNLSGGVREVSATDLQRLSAQIVWTLRQVPTVTAVRLLENGTPLTDIGVAPVQDINSWRQYDPEVAPVSHGALASHHGVVVGIGRSAPSVFDTGAEVSAPVSSANGGTVAGLQNRGARTALLVGSPTGRAQRRLTAPSLASPSFAPSGDVLVVDGVGAKASVIDVPVVGEPQPVVLPEVVQHRAVDSIAVSRDGSRIAMVIGSVGHRALVVGSLSLTHPSPTISDTTVVLPSSRDIQDVAWAGASELVAIGIGRDDRRSVIRTSVDGYQPRVLSAVGLPAAPSRVAAAPNQPILTAAAGSIWSLASGRWHQVSPGTDPSYAG